MAFTKLNRSNLLLVFAFLAIFAVKVRATPEEARRLKPVAEFTKNAFGSILLGEQMKFEDSVLDMVRGLGSIMWRSGAMFHLPATTLQRLQEHYDNIYDQVMQGNVSQVTRKTFRALKAYIDEIIDSMLREVEESRKNSFDQNNVKVGDDEESLEQALVNVGMQVRGYAVDVQNYRDLAKMVLGVPVVPTLASGLIDVSKLPANLINRANIKDFSRNSIDQVSQMGQSAVNGLLNPAETLNNGLNNLNGLIPGIPAVRLPGIPNFAAPPIE